jgi:UDP-glucuronate decarboxylase
MAADDGRVVSNFIVQALRGDPITIYGDGSQTRSFCFVDDLVKGLIALMNNGANEVGPVNLGTPGEFTMKELADLVLELTGSASQIEFLPLPQDDPKQRQPDISKARKVLGWEPAVALKDGLKKTIKYFEATI